MEAKGDKRKGWDRVDLAHAAGLKPGTVESLFKKEKVRVPFADDACALARAVGTTVEYLVTGEEPPVQDEMTPELKEICRLLRARGRDELVELTGVLRGYIDAHFSGGRRIVPGQPREGSGEQHRPAR
jgi:transcriptional regulator with XRE-family HTH domain